MRWGVYLAVLHQAANAQGVPNSTTEITFAQPIAQASSPPPATCPTCVFLMSQSAHHMDFKHAE